MINNSSSPGSSSQDSFDFSLVYITDLDNNNYIEHIDAIRENIKRVIRASSLNLTELGKLVGISRLTVKRFIVDENDKISFITANKFNNFVYEVHSKTEELERKELNQVNHLE